MNTDIETQEFDTMEAMVRQADTARDQALKDRDRAIAERDFARKQGTELAKQLKTEREIYDKEMRRASKKFVRDIRFPFALLLAFAGLALMIGLLVKCQTLPLLLGEQLGYGCICVCAFFGGIVWARTESRGKNNQH
jgi:hypothetical protein